MLRGARRGGSLLHAAHARPHAARTAVTSAHTSLSTISELLETIGAGEDSHLEVRRRWLLGARASPRLAAPSVLERLKWLLFRGAATVLLLLRVRTVARPLR